MAYSSHDDIEDLINRKEFYSLKPYTKKDTVYDSKYDIIPRFMLEDYIKKGNYLQLHSYQLFVQNFLNPDTPYSRLYMKWKTGTGKTAGSLSIAMKFIDYYRKEHEMGNLEIGSVFIIGFSERTFKNELMRFPEFGFLSRAEMIQLNKLRRLASLGTQTDIQRLQDFSIKIKKRFSNRKNNGFFRFFGYKAFVNRIFNTTENLTNMSEEEIHSAIKSGKIKFNTNLLDQFKNSLIICDEIHNVYNSVDKNNWGIAIQSVLDYHPSIRAVFLSATPLNNSPTEIVDLMNLLLPQNQRQNKDDYFNGMTLKSGALDKIAKLMRGRVSFVYDDNPKYFPSKTFSGEQITGIDYLKFIRCPMADLHYKTYKEVYTGTLAQDSQYLVDYVLPNPDGPNELGLYKTRDLNTIKNAPQAWKEKNGIDYVKNRIVGNIAKMENLKKYSNKYFSMIEDVHNNIQNKAGKMFIYHNVVHSSGVLFIEQILQQNGIISINANSTDNTLCVICGKPRNVHPKESLFQGGSVFETFTTREKQDNIEIVTIFKQDSDAEQGGFVIDNTEDNERYYIDESDVCIDNLDLILNEIKNEEKDYPIVVEITDDNIPMAKELRDRDFMLMVEGDKRYFIRHKIIGGGKKKFNYKILKKNKRVPKHTIKSDKHKYTPVRYIVAHSEIEKSKIYHSIEKYNNPLNAEGHQILILIGSKIIKESFDIKAIQNLSIMGRPDNIPTLIQIIGRCIRKNSHKDLPPEQRNVNIKIFTSCLPIKQNGKYMLSHEEIKYREKINSYKIIQQIEKVIHENAIDSAINYDIVMASEPDDMGALPYTPNIKNWSEFHNKPIPLQKLNQSTFSIFHAEDEVNNIIFIIKRLFIESSTVYNYDDLWEAVKNPPFAFDINTTLFNEDNFIVALDRLVWIEDDEYTGIVNKSKGDMLDKLFDSNDRIISINQKEAVITQVGEYYILFELDKTNGKPIKDIEMTYRTSLKSRSQTINIKSHLEIQDTQSSYDERKRKFRNKWQFVPLKKMERIVCEYGVDFHIKFIEEAIQYVFHIWVDPNMKKSDYHSFYFKMIYFYDLVGLIIWANTLKASMIPKYKKYYTMNKAKTIKLKNEEIKFNPNDLGTSGLINMLKASLNKSSCHWCPPEVNEEYKKNIIRSLELFKGSTKKHKTWTTVPGELLPVGHYIDEVPKFYTPEDKWQEYPDYSEFNANYKENPIIIGYDEKSATGVHVRFKIRSPIQNIKQYKDTRLIEKGSVCKSKNKVYLRDIAEQLGIKIPEKINVLLLCTEIRAKLIYNELKERVKKSKIKWFYFHYEKRPETVKQS